MRHSRFYVGFIVQLNIQLTSAVVAQPESRQPAACQTCKRAPKYVSEFGQGGSEQGCGPPTFSGRLAEAPLPSQSRAPGRCPTDGPRAWAAKGEGALSSGETICKVLFAQTPVSDLTTHGVKNPRGAFRLYTRLYLSFTAK